MTQAPKAAAAPSAGGGTKAPGVLATPKVRGLARQMGIDLNSVQGSSATGTRCESFANRKPLCRCQKLKGEIIYLAVFLCWLQGN